jgi:hypothetical protein
LITDPEFEWWTVGDLISGPVIKWFKDCLDEMAAGLFSSVFKLAGVQKPGPARNDHSITLLRSSADNRTNPVIQLPF